MLASYTICSTMKSCKDGSIDKITMVESILAVISSKTMSWAGVCLGQMDACDSYPCRIRCYHGRKCAGGLAGSSATHGIFQCALGTQESRALEEALGKLVSPGDGPGASRLPTTASIEEVEERYEMLHDQHDPQRPNGNMEASQKSTWPSARPYASWPTRGSSRQPCGWWGQLRMVTPAMRSSKVHDFAEKQLRPPGPPSLVFEVDDLRPIIIILNQSKAYRHVMYIHSIYTWIFERIQISVRFQDFCP